MATVSAAAGLEPATAAWLARLADCPGLGSFYLAGSAGLALHLGHRRIRDLDLMSDSNHLASADRRVLLAPLAAAAPGLAVDDARDGMMALRLADGVAVRLYYYPYPLIDTESRVSGMRLASLHDLALMKLAAVASRGARRDFVDLFAIRRALPLAAMLEGGERKFSHVRDFLLVALKGMADVARARQEPMPRHHGELSWPQVEAWIRDEVRALGRSAVGLAP